MEHIETKQEVLEKILAKEKPHCPHCGVEMKLWDVPMIATGDGLGWGTPYLYICFNDECESYTSGWEEIRESIGHNASYRCMNYPGTEQFECIPVFSPEGAKGQIIDDEVLMQQEQEKEDIKRGFSVLAGYYTSNEWFEVLRMVLDPLEPNRVRLKAIEMLGDIGDSEATEPLLNHRFPNRLLVEAQEAAIKTLHERHFTRECPFCAEIVKKRAKICHKCDKKVAGE